jgi:DNA-binding NarL/FixJ family response regulator
MVPPAPRRTVARGVDHEAAERWTATPEPAPRLTHREVEVLLLIAEGLSNHEIGTRLFLAEETVKSHVKTLLDKLHARSRAHAVAIALRGGMMD